jgi:hypothetical protein
LFALLEKNQKEEQEGKKKTENTGSLEIKTECPSSPHCYSKSGKNKMRGARGERGGL